MNVAVYPWEVSVRTRGKRTARRTRAAANAITAPITALTPEEGHIRVRIGPLIAESSREELDRLELERGMPAQARFSMAHARLLPLDRE